MVRAAALGSRERLGVDRIDLLPAHLEDLSVEYAETAGAFGAPVADGVIGAAGISNHPTSRIKQARAAAAGLGGAGYTVVQQRHSFLRLNPGANIPRKEAVDDELLDYVREQPDLSLMSYSSLLNGAFTRSDRTLPRQYQSTQNEQRVRVLRRVAAEAGVSANALALAWPLHGDPPVIPVLGVSTLAQLDESLGALASGADTVAHLETAPAAAPVAGH